MSGVLEGGFVQKLNLLVLRSGKGRDPGDPIERIMFNV